MMRIITRCKQCFVRGKIHMWLFLGLLVTLLGATLLYLSNKNQHVITRPLTKSWRLIGIVCCLLALLIWLQLFVVSAAIFTWLFTLNVALVGIPLLTLNQFFCKNKGEE